jgi:hypothetical protein
MKRAGLLLLVAISIFSFTLEEWKTIYSQSGLNIKSKKADCELDNAFKQRWFLLEFSNTSSDRIKVEWNIELYDENGKCVTCEDYFNEYQRSMILEPFQTKKGECSLKCPAELRIVSKMLDVKTSMSYPEFKLGKVKVTKLAK